MIRQMRIRNFQKHRKLTIDFDPVTSIVGPTDAGKSTLIRALSFICLGKWNPCYVRHGKDSLTVELDVGGRRVRKDKGKGTNVFELDGKEFRAFKNAVPPEIEELLNVGPENFQKQLDAHFWFSDTSGQVSKKLNQIVNLEIIDHTLANLASELKRSKLELHVTEDRYAEAKSEFNELSWVPQFLTDFERLETLKSGHRSLASSVHSLTRTLAPVRSLRMREKVSKNASNAILDVMRQCERKQNARKQRKQLGALIEQYKKVEKDLKLPEVDASDLEAIRMEGDQVAERRRDLEFILEELRLAEGRLCGLKDKVAKMEVEVNKKGQRCPTCGQRMTRSVHSHPTSTGQTTARSAEQKEKTGRKSNSGRSESSATSATKNNVPW
jgi:DNA repair exonuclease SbcCD ATPase subunit